MRGVWGGSSLDTDTSSSVSINLQTFLSSYTEISLISYTEIKPTPIFLKKSNVQKSKKNKKQNYHKPELGSLSINLGLNSIKEQPRSHGPICMEPHRAHGGPRWCAGLCAPLAGSFRWVPSLGHPNFLSDTVDWLHTDMKCMKVGASQPSQCTESLSVTPGARVGQKHWFQPLELIENAPDKEC